MKTIGFDLINKNLIIDNLLFDNEIYLKKLKGIGLFKGQKISVVRIGNYKKMIGIKINDIVVAIRLNEAKKIIVKEENDENND